MKQQLNKAVEMFHRMIMHAYEESCSYTYTTSNLRKPSWMTKELTEAKIANQRKLTKARRSKSTADWKKYHDNLKEYKKLITKTKTEGWKSFYQEAENTSEITRTYKILKTLNTTPVKLETLYKDEEGKTLTTNPEETLNVLIDKHFGKMTNDNLSSSDHPRPSNINEEIYNNERVHKIVKNLSPFKAPGPDGIQAIHIQKVIDVVDKPLIHIMKACHRLQNYSTVMATIQRNILSKTW